MKLSRKSLAWTSKICCAAQSTLRNFLFLVYYIIVHVYTVLAYHNEFMTIVAIKKAGSGE